jgi:XTP/dITP diphosphohydrolase
MKRVTFATSNGGKFSEASAVLKRFGISVVQKAIELEELQSDSIAKIASAKAIHAAKILRAPVVVEDTGFFLDSWGNFPGPYSKWVMQTIGLDGVLKMAAGTNRKAHFETVVAFAEQGRKPRVFAGRTDGRVPLSKGPAAHHEKLAYDPVFIPAGGKKAYSQMSVAAKLANSSRSKAFAAFARWYSKSKPVKN